MRNKKTYIMSDVEYNTFVNVTSINSYDYPSKYSIEIFLRDLNKQERLKKLKKCFGEDLKIE